MISEANETGQRATALAHLTDTHAAFHRLLAEIGAGDWERPISGSAWNVREQVCHVANNMAFLYRNELLRTLKGKDAFKPPPFILNFANVLITRRGAKKSKAEAAALYDAGHAQYLAAIDTIRDDQWQRGAKNVLGEYRTVATCFAHLAEHFADHEGQIRSALSH